MTLTIKHNPDDRGVEQIEVVNTIPGIPGTTELSVLDWENRSHEDHLFGKILGKAKRVDIPDEIEDAYLKEGWDISDGEKEDGVLFFYDESVGGGKRWTAEQVRRLFELFHRLHILTRLSPLKVWGFGELNGERRHLRRIRVAGKDERASYYRLVYDYREFHPRRSRPPGARALTHSQLVLSEGEIDTFASSLLSITIDFL